jgi:hypothetical protein
VLCRALLLPSPPLPPRCHATCSSLHPGVTPLPGVDVWVLHSRSVLVDTPQVPEQEDELGVEEGHVTQSMTGYLSAALAAVGETHRGLTSLLVLSIPRCQV